MKNLHVLPTDKPSRLHLGNSGLVLCEFVLSKYTINGQHIYITSDEQLKHNDYYTTDGKEIYYCNTLNPTRNNHYKKVILTTDQDLIGVQAIDDEFLEWFVNNPSCEGVKVNDLYNYTNENTEHISYKIIIPQEEPKQELNLNCFDCNKALQDCTCIEDTINMKQETLEEARKYAELSYYGDEVDVFVNGSKWQAERMYSEEDMIEFGKYLLQLSNSAMSRKFNMKMLDSETGIKLTKDLFEQFKKK
jgi:hypothetical protein